MACRSRSPWASACALVVSYALLSQAAAGHTASANLLNGFPCPTMWGPPRLGTVLPEHRAAPAAVVGAGEVTDCAAQCAEAPQCAGFAYAQSDRACVISLAPAQVALDANSTAWIFYDKVVACAGAGVVEDATASPMLPSTGINHAVGPRVSILVYASEEMAPAFKWNLQRLSSRVFQISREFQGYGSKWAALSNFLDSDNTEMVQPEDVLVVLDAHDILANAFDEAAFEDRVRRVVQPNQVIFSAEGQCCVAALGADNNQFFGDRGDRKDRTCQSHRDSCAGGNYAERIKVWIDKMQQRAPAGAPDMFLNAGVAVGTAAAFSSMLSAADILEEEDDQAVLTALYLSNQTKVDITLDFSQVIKSRSCVYVHVCVCVYVCVCVCVCVRARVNMLVTG